MNAGGAVLRRGARAILLLLLAAAAAVPAAAVDLRDVLADYTLTSWGRKDGLAGPVWAFAQDADGFLWLGTDDGLVRFDGVRFDTWNDLVPNTLPHAPVRALRVARDNALWIGFGGDAGGVARVSGKSGRLFRSPDTPDAPTGQVTAIVEDRAHAIWAAGANGLFRFAGNRWQKLGAADGLPDAPVNNAYVDSAGTLWVGTAVGFFSRREAADARFEEAEASDDSLRGLSLSEDPGGRIWSSDPVVGFRSLGNRGVPPGSVESGRGYRVIHDRDGNLWVATLGQGLWRVRNRPAPDRPTVERTTVLSGLSSDAVRSVFEDRDGNIWAGTTEGIDRLVPHRVTPWSGLGIVSTIAVTPDDHILVGTAEGILRFTRTASGWQRDPTRIPLVGIRAIRAANHGRVWVLAAGGWFRIDGTRLVPVPLPPKAAPIDAIATDSKGGMFAIARDGTIYRDDGSSVEMAARLSELDNVRITSAFADRKGRFWVAFSGSRVGVLRETFTSFGAQEGLGPGPHYAFYEDQSGSIWVSGTDGLSRFANGQFAFIGRPNGLPPGGIFALAEDADHNLWLATGAGLLRVPPGEFDAAVSNPQYQLHYRTYDTSDGLAGFPAALGDSQAIRAGDGTLWFVTSRGMSMVEPRLLAAPRPAPRVSVERVEADDRPIGNPSSAVLPAGSSRLLIDYTAPELTSPLKLRFRYRMDGFDADWIDAGTRRQARYTNLPPRRYRFRVAVSGDDGRWAEREAALDFAIAPRFYQRTWFYAVLLVAASLLVYGAWQWRLRQLRRQFALVLGERVRLSRELHDTLLQSLVGVALEFESIAKSLDSSPAVAKQRVVKMRERVEEYIREARRSIWTLRSPALETRDLVEALRESGVRAAAGQPIRFEFDLEGTPRRFAGNVEHQLLRIGQEAVLNAVRHAQAHQVRMTLEYTDDGVALRVADDGAGFTADPASEATSDHYGITTMKERAQQVGGRLTITSRPNAGTVIEAVVPTAAIEDR
ncbi:MAG TPA: two-component regulator propeller domain-containing protein [Vicinamibacterales bacterium]|jgi:signal transduction histidine kinase/ligand-binding sensor domain-containing protein